VRLRNWLGVRTSSNTLPTLSRVSQLAETNERRDNCSHRILSLFRRRAALFDCGLLDAMPGNLVRIKKGDQLFGRDRFTYKNLADIPVILEQLGCKL
jgi:hypothetical protein